jgi:hypothetical protein
MPGVAHTKGGATNTEKEIHFSLEYIVHCKNRATAEILGVLVHEVVHCYQYDAKGSCPGGLIEGIAGELVVGIAYIGCIGRAYGEWI